jgi:hypothetical protein
MASAERSGSPQEGRRIAIVMTKMDVKDVAELHDKSIVIAGSMNISEARLKAAFATAGADGAAFKQGDVNDADEVGDGAVAAAILAIVRPEVAGALPEIPGYRLLRVEVAPETSR